MSALAKLLPVSLQAIGSERVNAVSARALYAQLGFSGTQWPRWYKTNILKNQFAEEHRDWESFDVMSKGQKTKDFFLHVNFAKKLAMAAHTEEGERVKDYFLACERIAHQGAKPSLPANVRLQISAALTDRWIRVFGIEGTRELYERMGAFFQNLPGSKPSNPQQVVQPTLGLIETPVPLQLEISVKKS